MQTWKEWKVKDAEITKGTRELGYKRRDAKKLLTFWGDWWWREEADEDKEEEEEEEEEEKEEEEEMEEEVEELGLPKSITSAGEESSSKPSPPNVERNVPTTAHTNVPTNSVLLGTLFQLPIPVN